MASFMKHLVSGGSTPAPTGAKATVGIISLGEMGTGVAKLLKAHGYRTLTNIEGRSENTRKRATSAGIELVTTDTDLAQQCDYILSIVPPRDALATAQRIAEALSSPDLTRTTPLYYLDLNAVSPAHIRTIASNFSKLPEGTARFIDGGIIGSAPTPSDPLDPTQRWKVPSIPLSGPHPLSSATPSGSDLATLLNTRHLNNEIGTASGLKMCFASLTKGFTALALQSFTTAAALGVLPDLQKELEGRTPATAQLTKGLTAMPPKAYRWVREMEEIGETFEVDGGFGPGERVFEAIAGLYKFVADGTELGKEITEKRKRGTRVEDVAACVGEGVKKRKVAKQ